MRRAARTDANQASIVKALRKAGVFVYDLSKCGRGIGDLLCYRAAIGIRLLECKTKHGDLTPDQREFHAQCPVTIVRSEAEALHAVGL